MPLPPETLLWRGTAQRTIDQSAKSGFLNVHGGVVHATFFATSRQVAMWYAHLAAIETKTAPMLVAKPFKAFDPAFIQLDRQSVISPYGFEFDLLANIHRMNEHLEERARLLDGLTWQEALITYGTLRYDGPLGFDAQNIDISPTFRNLPSAEALRAEEVTGIPPLPDIAPVFHYVA